MKPIENFENIKPTVDREQLPKGAYIVEIKSAEEKTTLTNDGGSFSRLEISFDICEGDYQGFYENDYRSQIQEDKRWKGVLRLYIPKEDGSEKDEWTKRSLRNMTYAVEESNPGYHWDWDESGLKGKRAGCLFRLEEWEYNGATGWRTAPTKFIPVSAVREGRFKLPADKPLKNKPVPVESISDDGLGDLPF